MLLWHMLDFKKGRYLNVCLQDCLKMYATSSFTYNSEHVSHVYWHLGRPFTNLKFPLASNMFHRLAQLKQDYFWAAAPSLLPGINCQQYELKVKSILQIDIPFVFPRGKKMLMWECAFCCYKGLKNKFFPFKIVTKQYIKKLSRT